MILTKKLAILIFSTGILFSSCSKTGSSGNNGNNSPANYLLRTKDFTGYGFSGEIASISSESFVYDKTNNQITDYLRYPVVGVGFVNDTIVFKRSGNIITATYNVEKISKKVFLNTHSLPDSLYYNVYTSKKIYKYNYSYDGDGNVTTRSETVTEYFGDDPTGPPVTKTSHFTWQNGNLVKEETMEYVAVYNYDETVLGAKPDAIMLLYDPYQNEMLNKNILKKVTYTYPSGGLGYSINYTYDVNGKVVSENQVNEYGDKILDRNSTYY